MNSRTRLFLALAIGLTLRLRLAQGLSREEKSVHRRELYDHPRPGCSAIVKNEYQDCKISQKSVGFVAATLGKCPSERTDPPAEFSRIGFGCHGQVGKQELFDEICVGSVSPGAEVVLYNMTCCRGSGVLASEITPVSIGNFPGIMSFSLVPIGSSSGDNSFSLTPRGSCGKNTKNEGNFPMETDLRTPRLFQLREVIFRRGQGAPTSD